MDPMEKIREIVGTDENSLLLNADANALQRLVDAAPILEKYAVCATEGVLSKDGLRGDLTYMIAYVKALKELKDIIKPSLSEINKAIEKLEKITIPAKMEDDDIEKIKVAGIATVHLRGDAYVTVSADNRDNLHEWLKENDYADFVKETVNASSLKSLTKGLVSEGHKLPEFIKFKPYTVARLTKA